MAQGMGGGHVVNIHVVLSPTAARAPAHSAASPAEPRARTTALRYFHVRKAVRDDSSEVISVPREHAVLHIPAGDGVVCTLQLVALLGVLGVARATIPQPRAPNFQYFERPNYRYPYYDEQGRGKLLYGYGGPELYQYKSFSPLEGIY
uniref:Uncharacterized protein n=1 Tax=Heliothis virescens TaxID=7102 RepID=A0A2A4JLM0_HELVI